MRGLYGVALLALLWFGPALLFQRYSAEGLRLAQTECRRDGILKVRDQRLWQALAKQPALQRHTVRVSRDTRPDPRFHRSVTQLSLDGRQVAELNILRFFPVSPLSWLRLGTPSPAFICAWDVHRSQYLAILPLFS